MELSWLLATTGFLHPDLLLQPVGGGGILVHHLHGLDLLGDGGVQQLISQAVALVSHPSILSALAHTGK